VGLEIYRRSIYGPGAVTWTNFLLPGDRSPCSPSARCACAWRRRRGAARRAMAADTSPPPSPCWCSGLAALWLCCAGWVQRPGSGFGESLKRAQTERGPRETRRLPLSCAPSSRCACSMRMCVCVCKRVSARVPIRSVRVCARAHTHTPHTRRVLCLYLRGRIVMNVLCGTGHSPPARARTCLGSVHWCCCCPDCRLRETGSKEGVRCCGRSGRWLGAGV